MSCLKVVVYTLAVTVLLGVTQASSSNASLQTFSKISVDTTTGTTTLKASETSMAGSNSVTSASMKASQSHGASATAEHATAYVSTSVRKSINLDSTWAQVVFSTSVNLSATVSVTSINTTSVVETLSPSVSQRSVSAALNYSNMHQSQTTISRSMTKSPTISPMKGVDSSVTSSTSTLSQFVNSGLNSVNVSGTSSRAHSSVFSKMSSRYDSPLPSSSTGFMGLTKVSSSTTARVASNQMPSVSMLSASGQSSEKIVRVSSSAIVQSSNVDQSTLVKSSSVGGKSSYGRLITMTTQHLEISVTMSMKNATNSVGVNATPSSQIISLSTSDVKPRPTLPPQGTKLINMEVTFNLDFIEEYNDQSSLEYKSLVKNLTRTLENGFKNLDGFVGVRIVFIKKGSVVCNYIVILAKDSGVDGDDLKKTLQEASENGKLAYKVKNIDVKEEATTETMEKLPEWALVIMILLGCLSLVFLITMIYFCVKYRRSILGDSDMYFISSGEVGHVHTYDRVSVGEYNKNRGYQGQKSAIDRRVIGSHTNPTYGANGALGD
ncbi:uncharacterized protein [Pocillopora verrucosa]|uniref:uncharacterized protein n=1 Tax=Pocillopora verrucosa TaxID=203993 RepID=UPI0033425030